VVFTVGGALPMIAGLILLPFYTNYLSDIHYTQILFYISISLLFQILFSFSVDSYFGIKYTQLSGEPQEQKNFIGTVATLLLFIGAGLLLLLALSGSFLFKTIYRQDLQMEFWPYGFYAVVTGFFNSYFKAASICLIYLKQARLFLIANLVNFFATIFITIGGLYFFPGSITGPMYGRLLSGLFIFLIGHYIFVKNGVLKFNSSFLHDLVIFCRPYLFFVLSNWILNQVDRYFLQAFISKTDLNTYDLVLKCFFGVEFIQNSLSAVIYPKLYEIWNKNKAHATTPESNRYFNVFTAINVMQLILFCIFIPLIYQLIIKNHSFYESEVYIGILAAGYAYRSITHFYMSTILFVKKINVLLKIYGFSAIFQLIATFIGVRYYGLNGAIYAGLATKTLQVVFSVLFTRNLFRYEFNYFKIMVIPFVYVALNVAQFIIFREYTIWLYLLQLALFGGIFYAVFKNEIRKVLVSFKLLPE
jgi:O-antigen/teichoic acid export membrane protein